MPYIKEYDRLRIEDVEVGRTGTVLGTPGELNYAFTMLAVDYFHTQGANYQAINDVLGALEGAKLEFYRRVAVPYEDKKIKENGDVY